jgi:hypothetical protein
MAQKTLLITFKNWWRYILKGAKDTVWMFTMQSSSYKWTSTIVCVLHSLILRILSQTLQFPTTSILYNVIEVPNWCEYDLAHPEHANVQYDWYILNMKTWLNHVSQPHPEASCSVCVLATEPSSLGTFDLALLSCTYTITTGLHHPKPPTCASISHLQPHSEPSHSVWVLGATHFSELTSY